MNLSQQENFLFQLLMMKILANRVDTLTESAVTRIQISEFDQTLAVNYGVLQDSDAQMLNIKFVALQVSFLVQKISPQSKIRLKTYA